MKKEFELKLDDTLTSELVRGVFETVVSMFGSTPKVELQKVDSKCDLRADVSGIINLVEDFHEGSLILSFPKATICAMLSKFYKKPITTIDESVKMGVGELTNILFGVTKKNLNEKGHSLKMALPSVILGEQHQVYSCTTCQTLAINFSSEFGQFTVYTCLQKDKSKRQAA